MSDVEKKGSIKKKLAGLLFGAVAIFGLMIVFGSFFTVAAGEQGLLFRWDALQEGVYDEGLHFKMPFADRVEHVTIQPIEMAFTVEVGADGAITSDNQTVGADTQVFYRYYPERLVEMRRVYGEQKLASILRTTNKEVFKEVLGQYTIFDIAQKQSEIHEKVQAGIRGKMEMYPLEVMEVKIANYDWSERFDGQIQATMDRAQQVKQAEQQLLLTEQEAQQAVKKAEADKQALITKAEGEKEAAALRAEAKALEGEGIRKYNQSVQANMQLELALRKLEIEMLEMTKWNGVYVPNNMYGPIPVDMNGGLNRS